MNTARKPFRINLAIVTLVISCLHNAGSDVLANELEAFRRTSKRTSMFRPRLTSAQAGEIATALELAPDVSQTKLVKDTIARLKKAAQLQTFLTTGFTPVSVTEPVKDVQPPQTSAPPVVPADAPAATAGAVDHTVAALDSAQQVAVVAG